MSDELLEKAERFSDHATGELKAAQVVHAEPELKTHHVVAFLAQQSVEKA